MNEALVSVIIPTFNRVGTIEKSIRSCLNQTYKNIEIIVTDDGSSDGTKELVEKLANEDSRIRFIENTGRNHGPSANRNVGIANAKGKYICFNDSDDEFRPTKIEKQMEKLLYSGADVNFCVKKKGDALSPWKGFSEAELNISTILYKCFTGTQSLLGKASVFQDEAFDELMNCNEDWELCIRLTNKYKMSFLDEILVDVDNTPDSVGSSALRGAQMMRYMLAKHKELYDKNPFAKKKFYSQIRYAEAVVKDEEKHTLFTKLRRYMALAKVMN